MEPVRPVVDRYALDVLARRTFAARDFHETLQGACRLTPTLAKELISTAPHSGKLVGNVAADPVHRLVEPKYAEAIPTPIPRRRGRQAAAAPLPPVEQAERKPKVVARRCAVCGTPIGNKDLRTCGPECERKARVAAGYAGIAKMHERSARMRAEGRSPSTT